MVAILQVGGSLKERGEQLSVERAAGDHSSFIWNIQIPTSSYIYANAREMDILLESSPVPPPLSPLFPPPFPNNTGRTLPGVILKLCKNSD